MCVILNEIVNWWFLKFCSVQVFVLDFPPRLNVDEEHQRDLRQEYHRVAVRMGM